MKLTERIAATADASGHVAPVGTIVAYNPGYYTGAGNAGFTVVGPASNTVAGVNSYLPDNWKVCDGAAVNNASSPIWNAAGRHVPDLTDSRFLQGSTTCGSAGGNNSSAHDHTFVHTHVISDTNISITLAHSHSISHTHAYASFNSGPTSMYGYTVSNASTTSIPASFDAGTNRRQIHSISSLDVGAVQRMARMTTDMSNRTLYTTGVVSAPSGSGSSARSGTELSNYNDSHSHTTDSQSASTTSGASFTDNRPQYLNTFYIIRIF